MSAQAAAVAEVLPTPSQPVATPTTPPKSIAVITCSTRPNRVNPAITAYISSLVSSPTIKLTTVDLATYNLPMFDEPKIPATLSRSNPTPGYAHAHTRTWSAEIMKHDAFIFVTPQYNWSVPASIKNAIDYLFWEWVGKGAAVVSYGGHGGGKGRLALEQVCQGCRMKVLDMGERSVELTIDAHGETVDGEGVVLKSVREGWEEEGVEEKVKALCEGLLIKMEVERKK